MAAISEGFEDGSLPADWALGGSTTSSDAFVDDSRSQSGTYSLYLKNTPDIATATWLPSDLDGGELISFVELWVYDSSNSNGCGFALVDSAGNDLCGWGSSNPDWEIWDADGWHRSAANDGKTDEWIRIRLEFDWGAGTFDFIGERASGSERIESGLPLRNNTDVERIELRSFGSPSRGWNAGENSDTWYDDVSFEQLGSIVLSGTVTDESTGDPLDATVRVFDWDGGDLLKTTTSDPSTGDYSTKVVTKASNLLVVMQPPSGLRPLAHGPVSVG